MAKNKTQLKVLFLDVDGVLNSASWFIRRVEFAPEFDLYAGKERYAVRQLDPAAVQLLNGIVSQSGCVVVLSSTWRYAHGLEFTQTALKRRGATFELFDETPLPRWSKGNEIIVSPQRGDEIQEWLDTHPEVVNFAIVDDGSDMGALKPHLVQTSWKYGLLPEHVKQLVMLLS